MSDTEKAFRADLEILLNKYDAHIVQTSEGTIEIICGKPEPVYFEL